MQSQSLLSVINTTELVYPNDTWKFSPSENYPEYRFDDIADQPNYVYRAIRDIFYQAGLDRENYNTPAWNPLGTLIPKGSRVFILCNFVHHRRHGETNEEFLAKCTHASVIRAVIDYLLIAIGETGHIRFGNAPVQSCIWQNVLSDTGADKLLEFYSSHNSLVRDCDLRALITKRDFLGRVLDIGHSAGDNDFTQIDLGTFSLLEGVNYKSDSGFRVSEYNPKLTQQYHGNGKHIYILHNEILNSDYIFSIPKLKTHKKVGLTCAIKGCVGAIAHKDCLAHHRLGDPQYGGDEYPTDYLHIRRYISKFHDLVWQTPAKSISGNILRVIDRSIRRFINLSGGIMDGSWYGNDTAWRMALDIARIIGHVNKAGILQDEYIRPHYVLVDGIVGGEGNGPLKPKPVNSGTLIFSSELPLADYLSALVMGFSPSSIQIIKNAFELETYPLTKGRIDKDYQFNLNGNLVLVDSKWQVNQQFLPPRGWRGHVS